MNPTCILCDSPNISLIDKIKTGDLEQLYKHRAHVDVKYLFKNLPSFYYYNCNNCDLKFYWPQVIGDGRFYDQLQNYDGYYMEEKSEFNEAAKWIQKHYDVLEIGCGTGNFTNFINCRSYTGLEFSEKSIQAAKTKGLNVVNEDLAVHVSKNFEKYDVVCYFQVLEHVQDPKKFIEDSLRSLKQGGLLILAVPSNDSFINEAVNAYLNMPPHHASRWTDITLNKLATLYHLSVENIFHEPLHKLHKMFYTKTKIYHQLNKFLKIKYKLVDLRTPNNLLYLITVVSSYIFTPMFPKINPLLANQSWQFIKRSSFFKILIDQ